MTILFFEILGNKIFLGLSALRAPTVGPYLNMSNENIFSGLYIYTSHYNRIQVSFVVCGHESLNEDLHEHLHDYPYGHLCENIAATACEALAACSSNRLA